MNICLIVGGIPSRFDDFMAEIVRQYPCAIQSMPSEAEMFFIDYLRKDMVEVLMKYDKPIHMIGYSSIQGNPKVFITPVGGNNEQ
jgi:hypothetical protein